jgi:hypothetical protein
MPSSSWCPNDEKIVPVPPRSACPICGTTTVAHMALPKMPRFMGSKFPRGPKATGRFLNPLKVTVEGILKQGPKKGGPMSVRGFTLSFPRSVGPGKVLEMLEAEGIAVGKPVKVSGTLAMTGRKKKLSVDSLAPVNEATEGKTGGEEVRPSRWKRRAGLDLLARR